MRMTTQERSTIVAIDQRIKSKGRANSALRLGLRQAKRALSSAGLPEEADACERALRRAERMDAEGRRDAC
jgi:hypothetical protein